MDTGQVNKIGWHFCALAYWKEDFDTMDRICSSSTIAHESGLNGNRLEKKVRNWETYTES